VARRTRAIFTIGLISVAAAVAGCGTVSVGPPIAGPPAGSIKPAHQQLTDDTIGRGRIFRGRSQVTGKSAAQVLAASVRALSRVHTFQFAAHGVATDGTPITMTGAFVIANGPDRAFSLSVSEGDAAATIRLLNGVLYVTANAPFWQEEKMPAKEVPLVADRWISMPVASDPGAGQYGDMTDPATVGKCAIGIGGGVAASMAGTTIIHGAPAAVLSFAGAGTMKLYVSAKGAPLPLLEVETGAAANASGPGCGSPQTGSGSNGFSKPTKSATVVFGDYNVPFRILPPSGQVLSIPGLNQE
jgi:hypothetical protein